MTRFRCGHCGAQAFPDHKLRPTAIVCPMCGWKTAVTFCSICRENIASTRLRDRRAVCADCMVNLRDRTLPPTPVEVQTVRAGLLVHMRKIRDALR